MVCSQESVLPLAFVHPLDEVGGGEQSVWQQSLAISSRKGSTCYALLVWRRMPLSDVCIKLWRFLVGTGNSKIPKKVIRYHSFGIGIGADIVFGISVGT